MAVLHTADQEQLQKLLLGQLSTADVERLATEYADDDRLAELADSMAGNGDVLLELLHNHETAVVDPEGERLVERLLERLKPALPDKPREDTVAMNKAEDSTEPSSADVSGKPQPLPERLEHYRPIKVLGQGGMGTVYLAEDTRLGREVAIKTLRADLAINPQFKQRFLREARTAAKLEHDNVIPIYSVGEAADGTPFLAMPLLKGEPLDALIRRTAGPLPVAMVVRLAREAASGLAAAHERGLIHRDIKPANIWLEAPTGRVKILDFGLAKAADAGDDSDSETHLTASGAIVGTPAYMAPEQASGHTVDGRADLFSLGCVLYELLCGKRAFSGPNTMSILMSLANHTPPAPDTLNAQCPAALSRLVMQLLEKDPAKRPASAEAVIQALDELDIAPAAGGWALLPVIPNATGKSAHPPSPTQTNTSRLSDSSLTLPATAVLPVRKRSIPKQRVALALSGVLLMLLAAVVYRIQTDKGTLVVEINDDDVEAKLMLKKSGLEVRDLKSGRTFSIQAEGSLREASGDFKVVDGQGLKLVVLDADGLEIATNEFKLVRDGKVRVRVTAETNGVASTTSPQALATNPDRRAAEYVLSIGGNITIREKDQERQVWAVAHLPPTAFELTTVELQRNQQVTDSGLASFQDCKNLKHLGLAVTKVSDEGLAFFANCQNLEFLELDSCNVGSSGLAHFQKCQNLTHLGLGLTRVSDADLKYFRHCQKLKSLGLRNTQVTDAGLTHLKDCRSIEQLHLDATNVTDAGLERFADLPKLVSVLVRTTKVTEAGVKKFSAALPQCKIEWDGGVIEPKPPIEAARAAVATLLKKGFRVHLGNIATLEQRELKSAVDLNDVGLLSLHSPVKSEQNPYTDPVVLEALRSIPATFTRSLIHVNYPLTGDELGVLVEISVVRSAGTLYLQNTVLKDADLRHLAKLSNLTGLYLDGNADLSDVGLTALAAIPKLIDLQSGPCKITGKGLAALREKPFIILSFQNVIGIDDTAVEHLSAMPTLGLVYLKGTKITADGVKKLSAALPRCKIEWDGGVIEPTVSPDRRAAEWVLSIGGQISIKVAGQEGPIGAAGDLPRGPFELTVVNLAGNSQVTDEGLARFRTCHHLKELNLQQTQVKDAGLAHFQDCKNLVSLNLYHAQVTDAGLAHFKNCKQLTLLNLGQTLLTDAGLAHFKDCQNLTHLSVSNTQVGDAGLAHLQNCTKLTSVALGATQVTDVGIGYLRGCRNLSNLSANSTRVSDLGLAHLKDCQNLTVLNLYGTQVTDAGLAQLKGWKNLNDANLKSIKIGDAGLVELKDCKQLTQLWLDENQISDAGLEHIAACPTVKILGVTKTKVTEAGVKKLSAALPGCKIEWDGGVIEPTTAPKLPTGESLPLRDAFAGTLSFFDTFDDAKSCTLFQGNRDGGRFTVEKDSYNLEVVDGKASTVMTGNFGPVTTDMAFATRMRVENSMTQIGFRVVVSKTGGNWLLARITPAGRWSVSRNDMAFPDGKRTDKLITLAESTHDDPNLAAGQWVNIAGLVSGDQYEVWVNGESVARGINAPDRSEPNEYLAAVQIANIVTADGPAKVRLDYAAVWDLSTNPDRRAAEWVLSIGGRIMIKENRQAQWPVAGDELPRGTFELAVVRLAGNQKVSDAGLVDFKDCKNLTELVLNYTRVTDAGLLNFKDCQNLSILELHGTQVSDAGMAHFKDCENLTILGLAGTKVRDSGLVHFKNCKNLAVLHLGSEVSDAGLAHFQDCKNLTNVTLNDNPMISDAGLESFARWPKLDHVNVKTTKVTEAGVKKLSAALPGCKIEWDGGVIEPTVSLDRRAAEWVLSIGGTVRIKENGQERRFGSVDEVPKGPFQLTGVELNSNLRVSDALLAHLQDCQNLTVLDLNYSNVGDVGLAYFKDCKNFTVLHLAGTKVSDAELARFQDCQNLTHLDLNSTNVSDAGLAHFRKCLNLTNVGLSQTPVSDAGLAHLKACKNLTGIDLNSTKVSDVGLAALFKSCPNLSVLALNNTKVGDEGLVHCKVCKNLSFLELAGTQVTDVGLAELTGCPKLGSLTVKNSKVTEAGVKKLSAALPGCKIEWDGGVIEPSTEPKN